MAGYRGARPASTPMMGSCLTTVFSRISRLRDQQHTKKKNTCALRPKMAPHEQVILKIFSRLRGTQQTRASWRALLPCAHAHPPTTGGHHRIRLPKQNRVTAKAISLPLSVSWCLHKSSTLHHTQEHPSIYFSWVGQLVAFTQPNPTRPNRTEPNQYSPIIPAPTERHAVTPSIPTQLQSTPPFTQPQLHDSAKIPLYHHHHHHRCHQSDQHTILKKRLEFRPADILLGLVLLVPRREPGLVNDLLLQQRVESASQRHLGLRRALCQA